MVFQSLPTPAPSRRCCQSVRDGFSIAEEHLRFSRKSAKPERATNSIDPARGIGLSLLFSTNHSIVCRFYPSVTCQRKTVNEPRVSVRRRSAAKRDSHKTRENRTPTGFARCRAKLIFLRSVCDKSFAMKTHAFRNYSAQNRNVTFVIITRPVRIDNSLIRPGTHVLAVGACTRVIALNIYTVKRFDTLCMHGNF